MGWLSKLAVVLSQLPVQFLCFKGWLSRLDLQFTYLLLQQFKILCELLCIRSFAFDIFFPASVFCIELIAAKLVAPIGNAKCVRIWKDKYKNSIRKKLEHIRAMNVKLKKKKDSYCQTLSSKVQVQSHSSLRLMHQKLFCPHCCKTKNHSTENLQNLID